MSRMALIAASMCTLAACGGQSFTRDAPAAPMPFAVNTPLAGGEDGSGMQDADITRRAPQGGQVLVHTASVSVSVERYEVLREALGEWLAAHGGQIADENLVRTDGQASWANLGLRVPASDFDPLIAWLQSEFPVDQLQVTAADVTMEWVDLDARVRSYRATEERLLSPIADRTATLADVLAAETELSRVRGEIESIEGRRRVLADQVSMASVALHVGVRTPFAAAVADPLSSQAGRAFTGSLAALGMVARGSVVACAALAPWLLLLGMLGTAIGALTRQILRKAPLRS